MQHHVMWLPVEQFKTLEKRVIWLIISKCEYMFLHRKRLKRFSHFIELITFKFTYWKVRRIEKQTKLSFSGDRFATIEKLDNCNRRTPYRLSIKQGICHGLPYLEVISIKKHVDHLHNIFSHSKSVIKLLYKSMRQIYR